MATEDRWLASRRKRNRDLRDFIPVHGKILKPSHASPPQAASSRGERDSHSRRKQQVPLARLQRERRGSNKAPATAFSTGVRRKAPLSELQENLSHPTPSTTSHTEQRTKLKKEDKLVRERRTGEENDITSVRRKIRIREVRENSSHSVDHSSTAEHRTNLKRVMERERDREKDIFSTPRSKTEHRKEQRLTDPGSRADIQTVKETPCSSRSLSPAVNLPSLSPALLTDEHTAASSPARSPPITMGTTSPGELFSSPSDGEKSASDDDEFHSYLSPLLTDTEALIAELEECEKLCDRLLNLT